MLQVLGTQLTAAIAGNMVSVEVSGESEAERMQRVPFRVKKEELVGRDAIIQELVLYLEPAGSVWAVTGPGGIGKTVVSAAAAMELLNRGIVQCIFFMQATSTHALTAELVRFGKSYLQDCDLNSTDNEAVQAATRFFEQTTLEWLVILDDVNDWEAVRGMVPVGKHGRVAVTSHVDLSSYGINTTELQLFSTDESLLVGPCVA